MAKTKFPQNYPRLGESSKHPGLLDPEKLTPHIRTIGVAELKKIIGSAVEYAHHKSSRAILDIPETATDEEVSAIYLKEGRALFSYFKKYCRIAAVFFKVVHCSVTLKNTAAIRLPPLTNAKAAILRKSRRNSFIIEH